MKPIPIPIQEHHRKQPQKYPHHMIVLKYFFNYIYFQPNDKIYIYNLLKRLFFENTKFRLLVDKYKKITVVKPLHYDMSNRELTRHFNIKFPYTQNQYHAYVHNDNITSLTEIINVI